MEKLTHSELFDFLELKYLKYNQCSFIESDPISIPHQFSKKEDIEIAGFLTSIIAWGQRTTIINNANRLMNLMEGSPFEFIIYAHDKDFLKFENFVHRTFNGIDCICFLKSLQNIYRNHQGLETVFSNLYTEKQSIKDVISEFNKVFFEIAHISRSEKHLANPINGSAAKRLNMFLRWMIRKDKTGVDFGIWKQIPTSALFCPLDVHSGNVARTLGLLNRKQNDWNAVEELTSNLRKFDSNDPVKYDFALFGLGVFEKFK
ncbi:MAG: TIGR02757 family protein [Bacteroidetes bacterium]|nr:TIGR02757 family protein [Bacteroidota bacterium]